LRERSVEDEENEEEGEEDCDEATLREECEGDDGEEQRE